MFTVVSFSCCLSSNALIIISKLFRISESVTINCPISLTENPRTSQSGSPLPNAKVDIDYLTNGEPKNVTKSSKQSLYALQHTMP